MNRSESIKNVMTALGKFQGEELKIRKDSQNPHFKSKYASLSVILDEIQPALTRCGLVFTQIPDGTESLITMLFHSESGEFIEAPYKLNSTQNTPQGIGSAITYARRYSLTSILGLNIDDDDDGNEASKPVAEKNKKQETPAPQPEPQQIAETPYTKAYTDTNAIIAVAKSAATITELSSLYISNQKLVDDNETVKKCLSDRRDAIKNHGKVIITTNQFMQVLDRLRKGDATVYQNAVNSYILNTAQLEELEIVRKELTQLDEALALKYTNPEDINNIINLCASEKQLTKLHSNNAMIIDRDPELKTRLNARIRAVKPAA